MKIFWCRDRSRLDEAVRFFQANLTKSYISHSELQSFRAAAPGEWNPDITKVLYSDTAGRITAPDAPGENGTTQLLALIEDRSRLVGVSLVTFSINAVVPFCILEDVVIAASERGKGLGGAFMRWLEVECRARRIFRIFLESGVENHDAHKMFERSGFQQISVVMMKQLEK